MSMESASGSPPVIVDQTLRTVLRPAIGGNTARLRFSNLLGSAPLLLRQTFIGCTAADSVNAAGAGTRVMFNGEEQVTVPPGLWIRSDPVAHEVAVGRATVVTFSVSSSPGLATGHRSFGPAHGTTYLATGSQAAESGKGFAEPFSGSLFLVGMDVLAGNDGAIVCLGDSITEASGASCAYSEVLSARLRAMGSGLRLSVVNAGVGGDAIRGVLGRRLQHDVLDVAGVVGVILLIGTNDIGGGQARLDPPTPEELFAGISRVASQLLSAGLKVWVSPIPPFGDRERPAVFVPHYSDVRRSAVRRAVNDLLRSSTYYDPAIDFDRALSDTKNAEHIPVEFSEDNLHPTGAGQSRMTSSIDAATFAGGGASTNGIRHNDHIAPS